MPADSHIHDGLAGARQEDKPAPDLRTLEADASGLTDEIKSLLLAAFDAYVELDSSGRISEWSLQAEEIFGWPRSEAMGRIFSAMIVSFSRKPSSREDIQKLLCSGVLHFNRQVEAIALHRDGHKFPVAISISRMPRGEEFSPAFFIKDLTQRQRIEDEIWEHEERYRGIVESVDHPYYEVDLTGRYTFVNDGYCCLTGYSQSELLGASYKQLGPSPEAIISLRDIYRNVYATGKAVEMVEHRLLRKDGREICAESFPTLKRDAGGQPIGFMGITRDLTELKLKEQELAQAREVAEAASRAKNEFLANMSHEIRTPMNGILGMTDLALSTALSPEQRDCLSMVKFSAESLLVILDDILDYSRIEAGSIVLERRRFYLRDLMEGTVKSLALHARRKHIHLGFHVEPGVPDELIADSVRLRQVLLNLAGNAVKFTHRGEVIISVGLAESGQREGSLHFSVRDTGIGIAPDRQEKIFGAFEQADASTSRCFGGTGLGLAISSRLVQLMGGRIWVESIPEVGSTFHFTAALERAPQTGCLAAVERPECVAAGVVAIRPLRILVVEDNAVNQTLTAGLLKRMGHLPVIAANGKEALIRLEAGSFDLILMDVQMPEMDGIQATVAIRYREKTVGGHIPIVALTAHAMKGDRERCLAAGMDDYVSKPIDHDKLAAAIHRQMLLPIRT